MTKNSIKAAWIAAMLGVGAIVAWDYYFEYHRKQALAQELREIEQQAEQQRREELARMEQYRQDLARWEETVKAVERANNARVQRWERRVAEQQVYPMIAPAPAPPPPPASMGEPNGSGPVVAASPPPSALRVETVVPPPALENIPPPPEPPQPTVIEISAADGIRIELQKDTSWQTILQLLVLILVTYGGIKVINRFTENPTPAQ